MDILLVILGCFFAVIIAVAIVSYRNRVAVVFPKTFGVPIPNTDKEREIAAAAVEARLDEDRHKYTEALENDDDEDRISRLEEICYLTAQIASAAGFDDIVDKCRAKWRKGRTPATVGETLGALLDPIGRD